jgi:hypothetical protein
MFESSLWAIFGKNVLQILIIFILRKIIFFDRLVFGP